jgi:hypothetical protein
MRRLSGSIKSMTHACHSHNSLDIGARDSVVRAIQTKSMTVWVAPLNYPLFYWLSWSTLLHTVWVFRALALPFQVPRDDGYIEQFELAMGLVSKWLDAGTWSCLCVVNLWWSHVLVVWEEWIPVFLGVHNLHNFCGSNVNLAFLASSQLFHPAICSSSTG